MDTYAITEFFNYDLAAEYYAESTDYPDSTGIEVDYLKHGGILPYVLRDLVSAAA